VNSLQARLFITYLVIIAVTLSLTALSLLFLLGGYQDSITYGSLEDLGRLLDSQANAELETITDGDEPATGGADLLLVLRNFIHSRAAGGVAPATSLAVVDEDGNVLSGLWAGPDSLDEAVVIGLDLSRELENTPRSLSDPVRCRLDPPERESLLCVTLLLSSRVIEAFPGTEAAALVVAEPAAGLGEVFGDLAPRLVFSGLIGVASALLLGFLLSQSVAAPLRNIARAARGVARGSFHQRVPATGPREVRELATTFNRMTEEVQQSQETLRDFLANISHELKTPLTSIRGFTNAMLDGTIDTPEGTKQAMRVIDAEAGRVLRLVNELLALSRLESGQLPLNRETLTVKELFEHVREVFALRSEESGVDLEFVERGRPTVNADFDRLEQVLNNLLDNAFRHTPAGGKIRVQGRQFNPQTVEFSVTDNGPGISPEHLPHLFERFYRAPADGGERKGYGLGLAICREIVRAHDGEIRAVSELGRGTIFLFTISTTPPEPDLEDERPAARRVFRRARRPTQKPGTRADPA